MADGILKRRRGRSRHLTEARALPERKKTILRVTVSRSTYKVLRDIARVRRWDVGDLLLSAVETYVRRTRKRFRDIGREQEVKAWRRSS